MWNGIIGLFQYMEQTNLYNEINFNLPTNWPDNATAIRRSVEGFTCPSYQRPPTVATGTGANPTSQLGTSDYRGNMAAGFIGGTNSNCPTLDASNVYCNMYDNGMMYQNSTVTMQGVTDGKSTTVLLGECIYPQGVWSQASSCCVRTQIDRTINRPIVVNTTNGVQNFWTYWASKHPGQVNFGYCDGTVRPVTSGINKLTLNKLMTRAGGETISADETK
jgi:prepilin-type processing-associated H-X9-DG protein